MNILNFVKFLFLLILPIFLVLINDIFGIISLFLIYSYLIFWILRGFWRYISGYATNDDQKETAPPEEGRKTLKELHEEIKQKAKEAYQDADKENARDLKLLNLISEAHLQFGELMELIQTSKHAFVRLLTVYIFLEQLSPNYKSTSSSLGKFLYLFAKQELSPEEWEINFFGNPDDELDLNDPDSPFVEIMWNDALESRISSSLEKCPDQELKSTMSASFCADLVSEIEDDELINRFTSLARTVLKEEDLFSPSTESTLLSIEF